MPPPTHVPLNSHSFSSTNDILTQITETYDLGSVTEVRLIMALTSTIISGSWALLAMAPGSFTPCDLDFYTGANDTHFNLLLVFLYLRGYRVVPGMTINYTSNYVVAESTGIYAVMKLTRRFSTHTASVHIVISRTNSKLSPIFRFHSTIVMNFIAWYGIVCLYPDLTLQHRGLINENIITPRILACINKYRSRSFDLQDNLNMWEDITVHICGVDTYCPTTTRYLLDTSVKFIPFQDGHFLWQFVENKAWKLRVSCQAYHHILH